MLKKQHPYGLVCKKAGVQIKRVPKHISGVSPESVCAGSYPLAQYMKTVTWVPTDIDIFLTEAQWRALPLVTIRSPEYLGLPVRVKNELGSNVQYITLRGYENQRYTPQDIIRTFDITVCQVAMFLGYYFITDQAIRDIKNGVFHTIEDNIHNRDLTKKRIRKYRERGFKYLGQLHTLDDILFKENLLSYDVEP